MVLHISAVDDHPGVYIVPEVMRKMSSNFTRCHPYANGSEQAEKEVGPCANDSVDSCAVDGKTMAKLPLGASA